MEKYGLKYLLDYLTTRGLNIDTLTTDQHIQIRAFLKKEYPNICHQYDIWHRAENLRKKIEKVAKKKAFQELQPWIRAIISHFWWCCSNCGGDVNRLRDIWTSLQYHIRNIHQWPDASSSYNSCAHRPLTIRETVAKRWLTGSSAAYTALQNIILDPRLLNDMPNLVWFKHSGNIKVYHNLLCKYCPKKVIFFVRGDVCKDTVGSP